MSPQLGCLARQRQRQRFSLPRGPRAAQLCPAAGAQQSHGGKKRKVESSCGDQISVGNWWKNLRKRIMENPMENLKENIVEFHGKSLKIYSSAMSNQWDPWWNMQVLGWCRSNSKWGDGKTLSKARVKRWAKASCSVQQGCLSCATTESCAQTIWFWGQNDMNDGLHQNP